MNQRIKLILALLIFTITIGISQKKIDHVLRKYKNDANVTSLDMSGDFKKMVQDEDLRSEIESLNVLVFSKNEKVSDRDLTKIKDIMNSENFEALINVKNKDAKFKVYVVEDGDFISDLYAEINSHDYQAYITIRGKVIYEELSKFNFNFEGAEVFNQLKD
jgi:hypothetical protein